MHIHMFIIFTLLFHCIVRCHTQSIKLEISETDACVLMGSNTVDTNFFNFKIYIVLRVKIWVQVQFYCNMQLEIYIIRMWH